MDNAVSGFDMTVRSASSPLEITDCDASYTKMEDELTCPVCLELFADPLMLPCSHSLCKRCLEDIFKSRAKSGKEGMECPSCRKKLAVDTGKISKFPKNLALENIVFRFQEIQSSNISAKRKSVDLTLDNSVASPTTPKTPDLTETYFPPEEDFSENCGMCEGKHPSRATWFCEQCSVLYCDGCLERFHPHRGALSHHRIRKPSQAEQNSTIKPAFCTDHSTEQATIFCNQCKQLVCHLCVCDGVGKHSGHKILAHDSACSQLKETVVKAREKLESLSTILSDQNGKMEDVCEEIEETHNQACQKIELQYQRLIEDTTLALRQQKHSLLSSLHSKKDNSLTQLKQQISTNRETSLDMEVLLESCKKILDQDHPKGLLSRATDVVPIEQNVEELGDSVQKAKTGYVDVMRSCNIQQELKRSMSVFRASTQSCLKLMSADEAEKCQSIIPRIKPPASPTGKGTPSTPRVQNKCLITWGFNSTSFTAEKLTSNSLWSVTVEKNSSHLGDVKNGYLFGVGIASENLSYKELVGMNTKSYGIVCVNGNLMFCHDSKKEQLMPMDGLPLSVTVYVTIDQSEGVILSYTVTNATWGDTLSGKKVLTKFTSTDSCYPVFSVSQRVKMQFPTHV